MYSLVADIGGTNTRVALAKESAVIEDSIRPYRNAEYSDIAALLQHYLANSKPIECHHACVAVAGPVHDDTAVCTNVDWRIDTATVAQATGIRHVEIMNDLQAYGHTLGQMPSTGLREIIVQPEAAANATQLVIGVGTGFNATAVYHLPGGRFAAPAEAGHVSMPIRTNADHELAKFIAAHRGYADAEEVLSGRGIENIHAWLGRSDETLSTACAPDIIDALAAGDARAEQTLRIFVRMLGMQAGHLALTLLPLGGIFLVGGVSRSIAPRLLQYGFAEAFCDQGRFSSFMQNFGVSVIEDDYAALTGCAHYLTERVL